MLLPKDIRSREELFAWVRIVMPRLYGEVMRRDLSLLAEDDPIEALWRRYFG